MVGRFLFYKVVFRAILCQRPVVCQMTLPSNILYHQGIFRWLYILYGFALMWHDFLNPNSWSGITDCDKSILWVSSGGFSPISLISREKAYWWVRVRSIWGYVMRVGFPGLGTMIIWYTFTIVTETCLADNFFGLQAIDNLINFFVRFH